MNNLAKIIAGLVCVVAVGAASYFAYVKFFKPKPIQDKKVEVNPAGRRTTTEVPAIPFTNITNDSGIKFQHYNGATGKKLLPETMGAGVAIIDFDRDGKPDILFVNSCPWPGQPMPEKKPCLALYKNLGDGKFEDVTVALGLNVTMFGIGACVGDFDNDGFDDIYVTGIGGDRLFKNEAGKKFTDVTTQAGIVCEAAWPDKETAEQFYAHMPAIPFGSSATFVDYDKDGKLDLFVCRYVTWSPGIDLSIKSTLTGVGRTYQQPTSLEGNFCKLYHNEGNGKFTDVSEKAGVMVYESEGTNANDRKRAVSKSLGVAVYDADGDGWPDLVVANDAVRNFFFHNVPDEKGGRKFEEKGIQSNVAYADATPRGAMGIDVGEYKPGKCGIAIANFANEPITFLECMNQSRLQFTNKALSIGLEGTSRQPLKFGLFFFDYDLDGRQDLLSCNGHIDPDINAIQPNQYHKQPVQLYWNTGKDSVFEPVLKVNGNEDLFKPIVGRGSAYLDIDGDGDLDLVLTENNGTAVLLRNDQKTGHNWVRLKLEGNGVNTNRNAIGAEVTLESGDKKMVRMITGAKGYLSQSELVVTFGLGELKSIDKVTVRWPNREASTQVWKDLKVNQIHVLAQDNKVAGK